MNTERRSLVVGVVPGQPPAVLARAADFAGQFGADLVCGFVDTSRYPVEEREDGTVLSMSTNADLIDVEEETIAPSLETQIARGLSGTGVTWTNRALAGDPAEALAHLADSVNAVAIVVGTRKTGIRRTLHQFFEGSVGARLAHRQQRPVIIIPLSPVAVDADLPWEGHA